MRTHAELLDAARLYVHYIHGQSAPLGPLRDQYQAASAETKNMAAELAILLPLLDSERAYESYFDDDQDHAPEVNARILAAIAINRCRICPHLRHEGPQPAVVALAVHRISCRRCTATVCKPPADEDDRCDWCGAVEVLEFIPITISVGPLIVTGDACRSCGEALRLSSTTERNVP